VMKEEGVTRSALAKRLGRSKGWVTQLLDGQANKTIRTVADVFAVLGREYRSFQRPIQISNMATASTSLVAQQSPTVLRLVQPATIESGAFPEPVEIETTVMAR
ncbi:MAG: hypothetical protein L0312_17925, partial [Acidobacteria bacterium]|nr:hypothetical protein [Acidobacteriota bacterium]